MRCEAKYPPFGNRVPSELPFRRCALPTTIVPATRYTGSARMQRLCIGSSVSCRNRWMCFLYAKQPKETENLLVRPPRYRRSDAPCQALNDGNILSIRQRPVRDTSVPQADSVFSGTTGDIGCVFNCHNADWNVFFWISPRPRGFTGVGFRDAPGGAILPHPGCSHSCGA